MRKYFTILFLTFSIARIHAQKIVRAEYFIDIDPSPGKGVAIAIAKSGDSISTSNINIPTTGLSIGSHLLGVRVRDSLGKWSPTVISPFDIQNPVGISLAKPNLTKVVRAEYFIDSDPSPGNGVPITVTKYGDSISVANVSILTTGLSIGSHLLGVRVRDSLGIWSPTVVNPFNIQNGGGSLAKQNLTKITSAEYFIDSDPSPGKGIPIIVSKYGDSIEVDNISISTANLPIGSHLLGIRVRDSLGLWSPTVVNPFNIQNSNNPLGKTNLTKIVRAEYFIDTDPSPGRGVPIVASKYGDSIEVDNVSIPTVGLSIGSHLLGVRVRDSLGIWSPTVINPFNIQNGGGSLATPNLTKLVRAEYFIDTDPSPGKGVPIVVSKYGDSIEVDNTTIPLTGLSIGSHLLGVRVRDSLGIWSPTDVSPFTIVKINVDTSTKRLLTGEYFFGDIDPGYGQGTLFSSLPSSDTVWDITSLSINIPIEIGGSYTPNQNNYFTFRLQESDGRWSANHTVTFDVCFAFPQTPPIATGATICGGTGSATLTASGSANNTYIWYDNSWGSTTATYSNGAPTYTTPTLTQSRSYWVAKDTIGACPSNRTKVQVAVVDALSTPTAQNKNRCGAGRVTLTATDGAPAGGTYRWYDSNTATIWLAEGLTYTTDSLTQGANYWVSSVSNDGKCESATRKKLSVGILTCQTQTINFPQIKNKYYGVDSSVIVLKATAIPSQLPVQYEVVEGNNTVVRLSNDTLRIIGVGEVTIRASQAGNTQYYAAASQDIVFSVFASSFILSVDYNNPACAGGELKLIASPIKNSKYKWTGPTQNTFYGENKYKDTLRSPSLYAITFADSGTYSVVATDTTTNNTLFASIDVRIYPSPSAITLFSKQQSLCVNDYQLFTKGDGIVNYQWFFNGSRLDGNTDSTFKPSFTGVYSVTGFNKYGCPTSSQPIYVNVDADSLPSISRLKNPSRLHSPLAESHQWYVDNYYIANSNSQEIPLVFNGAYKVTITDSKGCDRTSPAFIINDDALANLRLDLVANDGSISLDNYDPKTLHVQPVPSSNYVELDWLSPTRGDVLIRIIDSFGKSISELASEKTLESFHYVLNVQNLAAGVYSILVQSEDKTVSSKIVVTR